MSTQRERAEEQRKQKIEALEQQVKDGSLTIRKMTDEERERFPRREPPPPRRGRGR
jgi:hypothetical protein